MLNNYNNNKVWEMLKLTNEKVVLKIVLKVEKARKKKNLAKVLEGAKKFIKTISYKRKQEFFLGPILGFGSAGMCKSLP